MLSKPMLKVFASSLVRLAWNSDEMKKEVKRYKEQNLHYFKNNIVFDFARYGVNLLFIGTAPETCKILYKITDRITNEILISNLLQQ